MPVSTIAAFARPPLIGPALIGLAIIGLALLSPLAHGEEPSALMETYGDWTVQCRTNVEQPEGGTQRLCQISQELRQPTSGSRVIMVAITKDLETDGAQLTLVAPFGLLLREGFGLSIDEAEIGRSAFTTCIGSTGCIAERAIAPEQLSLIVEGDTLGVHTVAVGGQKLVTNLSLNGFGVAFERLLTLR